jgi:hypothetical protein
MGSYRLLRATALGFSLAALATCLSGEARACGSGGWCEPTVRLFPFPTSPVPGNLIYFKVLVEEPGELTLRTHDGTVIPASIRKIGNDDVFAPDASVAPGLDLELEYTVICGTESEKTSFAFSTFDHMPINLDLPGLDIYEQGIRYPGLYKNEAVFTRLHYRSPAGDASAVHLMDHHVTVDGLDHVFEAIDHGGAVVEVHASCLPESTEVGPASCGRIFDFGTGVHHIAAWSTVVGVPNELQKAEVDIDLNCDAETDDSANPRAAGGGCSLSRSSRPGALALFVGALCGAVLLACRRRFRDAH